MVPTYHLHLLVRWLKDRAYGCQKCEDAAEALEELILRREREEGDGTLLSGHPRVL